MVARRNSSRLVLRSGVREPGDVTAACLCGAFFGDVTLGRNGLRLLTRLAELNLPLELPPSLLLPPDGGDAEVAPLCGACCCWWCSSRVGEFRLNSFRRCLPGVEEELEAGLGVGPGGPPSLCVDSCDPARLYEGVGSWAEREPALPPYFWPLPSSCRSSDVGSHPSTTPSSL